MKSFHFAPNRVSFKLTETNKSTQKEIGSFYFASHRDSFRLITKNGSTQKEISSTTVTTQITEPTKEESANNIKDSNKRNFLKILGMTGAGFIATSLFPKKAEALILGGTPTSSVVGVKNAANARINPATQETAATLLKTSDLTFDAGSVHVKVTSLPPNSFSDSGGVAKSGLVDADRHVQVDVLSSTLPVSASTETTLQTISFGGTKYALRLATVGSVDYVGEASIGSATSSAVWRVKKVDSTTGISITWAGTGIFNQTWDNYASLTYT